jgi:O-acetyl-ADP-ribose deacetylase (regulator of RNase III)
MPRITAVLGDITKQDVDAIVNAANNAMRGGGGVDGAIHRAGGPAVLQDCVERFPHGLATGDAGWTTAGNLPARWVIHTVGPNYRAGQRNPELLRSCYRRSLDVADELGARSVAFPLISAGIYGWPLHDAIAIAAETISSASAEVDDVRLVAIDKETSRKIERLLMFATPLRILQGVGTLHRRGYHRIRLTPGLSPSGLYWRASIKHADATENQINYSSSQGSDFMGHTVDLSATADSVADVILEAMPTAVSNADDTEYADWFAGLLARVEELIQLPIAYADFPLQTDGWDVGGTDYLAPPRPT